MTRETRVIAFLMSISTRRFRDLVVWSAAARHLADVCSGMACWSVIGSCGICLWKSAFSLTLFDTDKEVADHLELAMR